MKTFGSLKLTVGIVVSIVAIFIIGMIVPQSQMLGQEAFLRWKSESPGTVSFLENLYLTDIHASPYLLVLWGLFFVNLTVVMCGRTPLIWSRCMTTKQPAGPETLEPYRLRAAFDGKGVETAVTVLPRFGYSVTTGEGTFRAVKNRYAPLGTILFHVSFLLLLVGGLLTFYSRFRGEAAVGVGETFTGDYTKARKPRFGSVPPVAFTVEKITPTYFNREVPVNLEVVIASRKGRGVYSINRPYRDGPLSFVIMDIDVAPLFILEDPSGKEQDSAYVKLKALQGKEDSFKMGGYTFRAVFHPDYLQEAKNGGAGSANLPEALKQLQGAQQGQGTRQIINPAFSLAAYKGDKLVARELVKPGEAIRVDGARLVFADLSYWARFYAVMEHGLFVVYAGFAMMIIALSIRLLLYRRELLGVVHGGKLLLAGQSEYYPALFEDEFLRVTKALEEASR
jgi:hypothetical protein